MKFWKMHGIGNDFIAIDGRFDNIDSNNYTEIAKKVCHRRFSVGADGLLVVKNSKTSDVEMVYYNADGSRAEMCGNGLRCFAKFVYDNNIINKERFSVDTLDGIKKISINLENEKVKNVEIDMGKGSFKCTDIPVEFSSDKFINVKINVLDRDFEVSSMLMGVPHTIIYVDDLDINTVNKYGRYIEKHSIFPNKTNVNFVKVEDENNISVHTWERGCGYTLGCGTGMTASAVISNALNKTGKNVNVASQGGMVKIDIKDSVYMTGPAVKICEGILEV